MNTFLLVAMTPLVLVIAYLLILTVAALAWHRQPPSQPPRHSFAILVPAHNEEELLSRLLMSAGVLNYPRALFDIHVVADNCSDGTVAIARSFDVTVHERSDPARPGKGEALHWLLDRLRHMPRQYDAFVVLDADTTVSSNILRVMNDHLSRGDVAIQSRFLVGNAEASWVSSISYVALALFNCLRPRGRDMLGLSCGLHGSGMCFTRKVVDEVGWDASLSEDSVFHIQLVSAGYRVRFADQALVLAEQPTTLGQAKSQSLRWERGRLQTMRALGPGVLGDVFRKRRLGSVDLLAEFCVPQFSILTGLILVAGSVAVATGSRDALIVAGSLFVGEVIYVGAGLYITSASPRVYSSLLAAPVYAVWKAWTIVIAVAGLNNRQWVRTSRPGEQTLH